MPKTDLSLIREWYENHPESRHSDVHAWTTLAYRTDAAHRLFYDHQDWLSSPRQTAPPDLLECAAIYGYIRLRLKTWKLPIPLTPPEILRWRAAGYFVELSDFQEGVAQVAGGFLKIIGQEPQTSCSIISQQLSEKLTELDRLVNLPIDTHYTPTQLEWQVRERYRQEGFDGKQLDEIVEEYMYDGDHLHEMKRFDRPFALRQQLESFEWGMEKLRALCLTENAPTLGLPNRKLYDALMTIDLNTLLSRLRAVDGKLKKILENLATYDCDLNRDYEPERFWWRHWKKT